MIEKDQDYFDQQRQTRAILANRDTRGILKRGKVGRGRWGWRLQAQGSKQLLLL